MVVEGLVEIENCIWDNPNIKISVKNTGVLRLVNSTLQILTSPIVLDGGRLEITRTVGNSYIISSGCYAIEAKNGASTYIKDACEIRRMRSAAEKAVSGRYDKIVLLQANCRFYTDGVSFQFNKDVYLSGLNKSGGADVWNRIRDIHTATTPEEFEARRIDNDQSLLYVSATLDLSINNNDGLGGNSGIKTYNKQSMQANAQINNPKSGATYTYKWYKSVDGIMQQLSNTSQTLSIKDVAESGLYKCAILDGAETVDECEAALAILPKEVVINWTDIAPVYNGEFLQPAAEAANIEAGDECSVAISGGGIAAGSYVVNAVSVSNNNYTLPETAECFLTISAKPVSDFAIIGDYFYSGLPQNIAVVCTEIAEDYTLTLSGANNIVDAGEYDLEVTGISNGNYTITEPIMLTLTVLPRPLTYTIDGGNTSVYGEQVQSGNLLQGGISSELKEAVLGEAGIYLYIEGSPTQGTSVGKYRIKGGWTNTNYNVNFEEADYSITPREVGILYDYIGNFVFDNTTHYIDVIISNLYAGESVSLLYEASDSNVSYSNGRVAAVMAGSYSITFTAIEDNINYTLGAAQPLVFLIAKATIGIAFEGVDNLVYNGLPKAAIAIPKDTIIGIDCSLQTALKKDGVTVVSALAAGHYTLTVIGFDTPNKLHECYSLPNEGLEINFEISQAVVGVSFSNYSNLVYNGFTHIIDVTATGLFGEDAVRIIVDCDRAKEAGSYTTTVIGLDNANYKLPSENCSITYTVGRCNLTAIICSASSVYGEDIAPLQYVLVGEPVAGDEIGISLSKADGSDAGNYDIIGSCNGNKNYCLTFTNGDNAYKIEKRRLSISIDEKLSIYGDVKEPLSYTITSGNIVAGDNIGIAFEVERQDSFAAGLAGTYSIAASVSNTNYAVSVNQAVYTVLPRQIMIEIDRAYKVYGEPTPIFTATVINGVADDDMQIGLYSAGTKVGVYDIDAVCGNPNYIIAESNGQNAFCITPKELVISFDNYQGLVYNGMPHTLSINISGIEQGDVVELEVTGNNSIDAGSYCISVAGFAQGGKDNANYALPAVAPCQAYTIAARDLELGFVGVQDSVYNGRCVDISVFAIGQADGEHIGIEYIIYNTSNSAKQMVSQVKNTGCYEVQIVNITASANYNIPALISKSFVITPAPIEYIIDNQTSVFGNPIPTPTGKIANGYTVYENDDLHIRLCTSGKDAGSYAITGTASNPNYKVTFITATYTITQRELGLIFSGHNANGQNRIYKNTLLDIYIDVCNTALGDNIYFNPAKTTITHNGVLVGVQSCTINSICTADFAGDYVLQIDGLLGMGDNYCFQPTQLKYTIQKRQLTVSFAGCDGLVYNGKPHNIEAALGNIAINDTVNAIYEGISGINAGSYTARVASIDNANYLLPQSSHSYVIGKALPRISTTQYRYEFVQDAQNSYSIQASASNNMPLQFFVAVGASLIPTDNAFGRDTGEYTIIITTQENNNYQAALPIEIVVVVLATSFINNIAGQDALLLLSDGGQPNAEFIAKIASPANDTKYLPVYRSKTVRYICEAKLVEGNTVLDISNAEVRLKLPESLQNQQEITIMYNENGAIIYKTIAVTDGYIAFAMQELGEFALLGDKDFAAAQENISEKFISSAIYAVIITISMVLLIIVIRKKLYKT